MQDELSDLEQPVLARSNEEPVFDFVSSELVSRPLGKRCYFSFWSIFHIRYVFPFFSKSSNLPQTCNPSLNRNGVEDCGIKFRKEVACRKARRSRINWFGSRYLTFVVRFWEHCSDIDSNLRAVQQSGTCESRKEWVGMYVSENFVGPVLGCVTADFSNQAFIFQRSPRATRFTPG